MNDVTGENIVGITSKNILRHNKGLDAWGSHCIAIALICPCLSAKFTFAFSDFFTAPVVKNSHILGGIYFIFWKKHPGPSLKVFQYRVWTSVKRWESSYQVRQNLELFCKSVAVSLS